MGFQKSIQNNFYDFASASSEIVIVTIDEKSLTAEELGPLSQWPRAHYAKVIEILNREGAAAIGIDMTFPDSKADDQIFSESLKKYPNVVLATRYYVQNGDVLVEHPNETIMSAEPTLGWINVHLDEDGFIRKIPLFSTVGDETIGAFSLEIVRRYLEEDTVDYQVHDGEFSFSDNAGIPVITLRDSSQEFDTHLMYVNYFAEPGDYKQISMTDLLKEGFVDQGGNRIDFQDKIVLIGPTAIDLQDYFMSPVSRGVRMAGVEIHANNIQTLITEKFLRDQSDLSLWLTLLGLIVINLFLFAKLRIRFAIPILLVELFLIVVAGIISYDYRIFLNVVYPVITVLLIFIGTFLLRLIMEQKERKFIEGAFGHYVNKSVVDQILKDPKMMELGGARRNVTVFFSDIAGFTSISEKMEPDKLVNFLNRYLDYMTDIILNYKGTLDKYEGDAIMAFWGAPVSMEDHAVNTCMAALENQKKLAEFRKECEKENLPPINIRIGINTGDVIVGNMGSNVRFDYTVMGDTVNLGSRLEGINKQYGTEIIISEFTYEQVKDSFICRELDQIRVKGKEQPIRIYELMGKKEELTDKDTKIINEFKSALVLYRRLSFAEAMKKFADSPNDPPSKAFIKRCEEFIKNPPPANWDGVYTFTEK